MVFSLAYTLVRWLIGLAAVLSRGDLSKEVELLVLRHENAVLRRQVPRPRYQPADRIWLAALSRCVSRRRWSAVFLVTPATILRCTGAWSPERGPIPIGAGRGGHRRGGQEAGPADGPRQPGMGTSADPGRTGPPRPPDRGLDGVGDSADEVFRAGGVRIIKTPPQAPRANAICERVVGTLRREVFDQMLILNERHLTKIVTEYAERYNRHRPHQGRDQRPPLVETTDTRAGNPRRPAKGSAPKRKP
jgi:hypothetical protein